LDESMNKITMNLCNSKLNRNELHANRIFFWI
jgi:hypothetical protein